MALNKQIAATIEKVILDDPCFSSFSKVKANGADIRRFFQETDYMEREICFYRDKWWTTSGGTIYTELSCLVKPIQLALTGSNQSLANPNLSVPSTHFQYGIDEIDPERSWQFHSGDDIVAFETRIRLWLSSTALPWFNQFRTIERVLNFMKSKKLLVQLAVVLSSQDRMNEAKKQMLDWLSELPRQIDTSLKNLHRAGLLSTEAQAVLAHASIQREDHYRELLDKWVAGIRHINDGCGDDHHNKGCL